MNVCIGWKSLEFSRKKTLTELLWREIGEENINFTYRLKHIHVVVSNHKLLDIFFPGIYPCLPFLELVVKHVRLLWQMYPQRNRDQLGLYVSQQQQRRRTNFVAFSCRWSGHTTQSGFYQSRFKKCREFIDGQQMTTVSGILREIECNTRPAEVHWDLFVVLFGTSACPSRFWTEQSILCVRVRRCGHKSKRAAPASCVCVNSGRGNGIENFLSRRCTVWFFSPVCGLDSNGGGGLRGVFESNIFLVSEEGT